MADEAAQFFDRVHPEDLPGVHAEVERVFQAPKGEIACFDYRVVLPSGNQRYLRIRGEIELLPNDWTWRAILSRYRRGVDPVR